MAPQGSSRGSLSLESPQPLASPPPPAVCQPQKPCRGTSRSHLYLHSKWLWWPQRRERERDHRIVTWGNWHPCSFHKLPGVGRGSQKCLFPLGLWPLLSLPSTPFPLPFPTPGPHWTPRAAGGGQISCLPWELGDMGAGRAWAKSSPGGRQPRGMPGLWGGARRGSVGLRPMRARRLRTGKDRDWGVPERVGVPGLPGRAGVSGQPERVGPRAQLQWAGFEFTQEDSLRRTSAQAEPCQDRYPDHWGEGSPCPARCP